MATKFVSICQKYGFETEYASKEEALKVAEPGDVVEEQEFGFFLEKVGWGIDSFNYRQYLSAEDLHRLGVKPDSGAFFQTKEAAQEAAKKLPHFGGDNWSGGYRVSYERTFGNLDKRFTV